MARRRTNICLKRDPALSASRVCVESEQLVYILVCDKRLRYPGGRSFVAYIGTTGKGVERIARSVAVRANRILAVPGVRQFDARIVTCKPHRTVQAWKKLEHALLLRFRELFGAVPLCNCHGRGLKETDEFAYFRRERIDRIVRDVS